MQRVFDALLGALLGSAAVIALLWQSQVIHFARGDDRPAVSVSGAGTIELEGLADAGDQRRGSFEPVVAGDAMRWRAGIGTGQPPRSLTVVITGSASDSPACRPDVLHRGLTAVIFNYVPTTGIPRQFLAEVGQDGLFMTFEVDAVQNQGQPYRLLLPSATLKSVTLGGTNCDLGPNSRVEIRQRQ